MSPLLLIVVPVVAAVLAALGRSDAVRPLWLPLTGLVHAVLSLSLLLNPPTVAPDAWLGFDALARATLPALVGRRMGTREVVLADDFSYTDPVDGSVSLGQGVRVIFDDGARVVFRLSGTGTEGATLRLYLERYQADPSRLDDPPQSALAELAELAEGLAGIRIHTGMAGPTVVT